MRVAVGTPAQTQLAPTDLPRQSAERFSGIRCIAVQPQAPDAASLVAMVRQRLDALWNQLWTNTQTGREIEIALASCHKCPHRAKSLGTIVA